MTEPILIVDDDPSLSYILFQRLTREGHLCVKVDRGTEALRAIEQQPFSLVISDVRMPEMDGIELLGRLRARHPNLMVIMVTAHPEIERAIEALRLGAYDFLIKPVNLDLLVLSVRKALEKKRLVEEVEAYHNRLEHLVEERTAKLQQAYRILTRSRTDLVHVLAKAIDVRDPYTRGHSDRVKTMSVEMARHLGFSEERLGSLEDGALLHDIGKIGIRDEILQKPGILNPQEVRTIREHPKIGVQIVEGIEFFRDKIPMIRHHHEHFDGSGYPDRLAGEGIPLEARIIAVPDAFDAMTSLRPNCRPRPLEDILAELTKGRGSHFDPTLLDLFLSKRVYQIQPVTDGAVKRKHAG